MQVVGGGEIVRKVLCLLYVPFFGVIFVLFHWQFPVANIIACGSLWLHIHAATHLILGLVLFIFQSPPPPSDSGIDLSSTSHLRLGPLVFRTHTMFGVAASVPVPPSVSPATKSPAVFCGGGGGGGQVGLVDYGIFFFGFSKCPFHTPQ